MADDIQAVITSVQALVNQADTDGINALITKLTEALTIANEIAAADADASTATTTSSS